MISKILIFDYHFALTAIIQFYRKWENNHLPFFRNL